MKTTTSVPACRPPSAWKTITASRASFARAIDHLEELQTRTAANCCAAQPNIGIEHDNFGRFSVLVVYHKYRIGFTGTILIEPEPHEPTNHQYDFDTQTVYGF